MRPIYCVCKNIAEFLLLSAQTQPLWACLDQITSFQTNTVKDVIWLCFFRSGGKYSPLSDWVKQSNAVSKADL